MEDITLHQRVDQDQGEDLLMEVDPRMTTTVVETIPVEEELPGKDMAEDPPAVAGDLQLGVALGLLTEAAEGDTQMVSAKEKAEEEDEEKEILAEMVLVMAEMILISLAVIPEADRMMIHQEILMKNRMATQVVTRLTDMMEIGNLIPRLRMMIFIRTRPVSGFHLWFQLVYVFSLFHLCLQLVSVFPAFFCVFTLLCMCGLGVLSFSGF